MTQQPWSNGVVYVTGISADGLEDFATLPAPHPGVHAQFAMYAGINGRELVFPGGAVREALIQGWTKSVVPQNWSALLAEAYSHEAPGEWWNMLNGTLNFARVRWPSVMMAGWYDIFARGTIDAYNGYDTLSGMDNEHRITVDPLGHCGAAEVGVGGVFIDSRAASASCHPSSPRPSFTACTPEPSPHVAPQFFNTSVPSRVELPLLQLLDMIAKQDVTPPAARERLRAKARALREAWGPAAGPENAKNIVRCGRRVSTHTDARARVLRSCSNANCPPIPYAPADVLRHGRVTAHRPGRPQCPRVLLDYDEPVAHSDAHAFLPQCWRRPEPGGAAARRAAVAVVRV